MISVDTEEAGAGRGFQDGGREWRPKGSPEPVRVHDFKDKQLGKAIPYGVYDLANDEGWVNVGIDHDTAQFAVASIQGWWEHLGKAPPRCQRADDHRRLRRLERQPHQAVEDRAAENSPTTPAFRSRCATSRPGPASGTKSSTAYSASSAELARQTTDLTRGDHQPDQRDHQHHRP